MSIVNVGLLFVDLANVRFQNSYSVYRRIVGYYNDDTDAFDMRKPLSRDKERKHVRADGEQCLVDPSAVW